jgi:hypothetical protein
VASDLDSQTPISQSATPCPLTRGRSRVHPKFMELLDTPNPFRP